MLMKFRGIHQFIAFKRAWLRQQKVITPRVQVDRLVDERQKYLKGSGIINSKWKRV